MFHCMAQSGADLIVGGSGADRSLSAWRQAYRAIDHGLVRQRCEKPNIIAKFPTGIKNFANVFVSMQKDRHDADYDPTANFFKSQVLTMISDAEAAIVSFQRSSRKDRRAFAVYVLLNLRS